MKKDHLLKLPLRFFLMMTMLVCFHSVYSQTVASLPDTSKMTYNQISTKFGLYVFPAKSQSQQQQKIDEFECYKWAMEQSGIDPLNLPKVEAAPVETGPDGSAVRGAARGAAAGVAIGAIAGDAGTGCSYRRCCRWFKGQATRKTGAGPTSTTVRCSSKTKRSRN